MPNEAPDTDTVHPHAGPDYGLLAALSLPVLLSSLGTSIANIALPTIASTFGASFAHVQWVVLAYLLTVTTLIVVAGRLGDAAGRRRVLMGGVAVFSAASLACGLAPALPLLVLARAAQGVGAAVMMALAPALVSTSASRSKAGSMMGLLGAASATGTAIGPSLGGALIALSGWRALFLVQVPLAAIALVLIATRVPSDERATVRATAFDARSVAMLAVTLTAYVLSMTVANGVVMLALLLAAMAGLSLFVALQRRSPAPLISPAMFTTPGLRASLVLSGIVSTIVMATLVVGPFYLARALRLDAVTAGFVLSIGPVAAALSGVPAGRLVDRFGSARTSTAGLIAITCGSMTLALLPYTRVITFVVPVLFITAGYALFQTANNTAVLAGAGAERGLVSGMLNLSRNVGLLTGASLIGALFARTAGMLDPALALPEAVAFGFRSTFAFATLLGGAGLAVAVPGRVRALIMGSPCSPANSRATHAS